MLQPRLLSEMGSHSAKWTLLVLFVALATCQEITQNEPIEVSRIKREGVPENRDLTVLLVNDQNRNDYASKIGRYHSVKPLIGLLTSTARTFIQDGVTTEFATQILGTTLDNGRIYAQVLTKSSLVLYSKPSNDDPYIVSPTRVPSLDGWNVKQDLGIIDPDKFVLKNTDYLAPSSKMDIVYPSKPSKDINAWNAASDNQVFEEPTGRRIQAYNEIPRYEVYNYLDGPAIDNEKKVEYIVQPSIFNNGNVKEVEPVNQPLNDTLIEDTFKESDIVKVKPNYDLPTFTIKNEFSPIFYYIDNVETRPSVQQSLPQTKQPKKLFGHKSEPKPKKTFTYQGFADFTTVVGDTVIIFTPNTDTVRQPNPDEVNVFPSARPVDKFASKVTFLSAEIPVATSTYKAYEENVATKLTTHSDKTESDIYNNEPKTPDTVSIQYSNGFDLNLDVIQPSEPVYSTTESTRHTDDIDIEVVNEQSSHATEPLTTLKPSSTLSEDPKESAITESNNSEIFTNSEEESENTAAEITETTDDDEEFEEHESTREMEHELFTTTESGHSEESEEMEPTTENILNKHEEVFCEYGLESQSIVTTEYKTLTYLTTYFIPLETETTTSVKSDVVVESNVGFSTNVICKTNQFDIEPTSVVNFEVSSTEQSNIEAPAASINEPEIKDNILINTVTEKSSKTTPMQKDSFTNEPPLTDVTEPPLSNENEKTPTTERITTSQSHIEVSVSTEHTPTEKPEVEEEIDESVNEIDLIYKTLYTTYTYFTTFFGEQTSSVASHKSIVTNIITSTVDLSKLDPSLLGAFDDEISPTNVGIGRPTETFAINSIIDLVKNKDVIESVESDEQYNSQTPTPVLGDDIIASIHPEGVKTYFTTYTFFTTIYVGSDANVCSRSEVYTNYVGPDELIPTKANPFAIESTRAQFDFRNCKQMRGLTQESESSNESTESSISMKNSNFGGDSKEVSPQATPLEVDMLFSVDSNPLISENSFVTDVKSSSSKGETKLLDNNNVLDDQISSESNIDEIMPSPTLLLQTSYTTFTYFTTMYIGKDSSKVKSRLETITNVVTETITPKTEPEDESNLPITYYTTFTYWTTLYKDKSTTITSREEIVSNVVTPTVQTVPSISPIDTSPIDVESILPSKELDVILKPSLIGDDLDHEDGKATFYTTYTYFTTFYTGNTSQIRSSLATVTNIVDNTKILEDNQLGRKVQSGSLDQNLIQDVDKVLNVSPTPIKEEIKTTQLPDLSAATPTILQGTYIDNLFAEVKPQEASDTKANQEKKIIFSQVAVIAGDSTIITSDNSSTIETTTSASSTTTTTTETANILTKSPEVIESSVTELETTTTNAQTNEEEDDDSNPRKKGRLSFTTKKPTFTPVIIPFASRNRPTFSPKRQPLSNSATTITRPEYTPTITATPTLKSPRPTGTFSGNRKPASVGSSLNPGRKFTGRSSATSNLPANIPASRPGGFGRASIQPSSRRTGFRSSSLRSNSLDYASRSAVPKIRPTATSRLRSGRQSTSVYSTPADQNESETYATQQDENATESLDEVTESPSRQTTNNPLSRFRRPPISRQPGTALAPRSTTPASRRAVPIRSRTTTTTRRTTTRTTNNPLLSLRRQRPNALFPRRNLFKQPEPEPEEEIKEDEQKVDDSEEILEEEEFEEDNDYDSSDRKEQKVATPEPSTRRPNVVSIRPFGFKRRVRRQVDYGNRKYTNFRRPGTKSAITRKPEPEPETEPPAPAPKPKSGRLNSRVSTNSRTTTVSAPKSSARQPFIVRGESRTTTVSSPAYKRTGKSRSSSRTTTLSSRPKAPRLTNKNSPTTRSSSGRSTSRSSRTRTTTSRASSRQRNSFENFSGERHNKYDNVLNDGKITVTHQVPYEVTIPVVNGKITEYKNVLTAKPSIETLLLNQVSTSLGPLGNQQLVLAAESTELADNGATKVTRYILHETPTTTVIFTPTTIRGRKTRYSHVVPSTVYNVEPVVQTVAPEINANVPLANLLLSQLLLGNQQPAINPLLALQGQALLPQQQVVQTPVTEYKTRSTTYVTTVTDARETVLPITFRGTPILTTIVDPTTNVITATEIITDTVVTTPTVLAPQPQFNSLLLPLLLQQQQQQQQGLSLQTANPLLGLSQNDFNLLSNNLGQNMLQNNNNLNNDIYSNSPKPNVLSDFNSNEDFAEDSENEEEDLPPPSPAPPRRRNKPKTQKPSPPKLTSVVTLYVSGKHPGEFSTVLSTVVTDDTQTVRKREAIYYEDVKILPSILPTVDELFGSQGSNFLENSIVSEMDKYFLSPEDVSQVETQSLESIVGSISNHIKYDASPTYVVKLATPSVISDTKQISVDDIS